MVLRQTRPKRLKRGERGKKGDLVAGDDPVDYPVNEQVATHLQQIADCSEEESE